MFGFFSKRKIFEAHYSRLLEEIERLTSITIENQKEAKKREEEYKKRVEHLTKEVSELNNKINAIEALFIKGLEDALNKMEYITKISKNIYKDIIPRDFSNDMYYMIRNIHEQINIIPKEALDIENMPPEKQEHFKFYLEIKKEMEKSVEDAEERLEKFIKEYGDESFKKQRIHLAKSLNIINGNFKLAIANAMGSTKSVLREIQSEYDRAQSELKETIKDATRNPASRNSYL